MGVLSDRDDLIYAVIDSDQPDIAVPFDAEGPAILAVISYLVINPDAAGRIRVIGYDANGVEVVRLRPRVGPSI